MTTEEALEIALQQALTEHAYWKNELARLEQQHISVIPEYAAMSESALKAASDQEQRYQQAADILRTLADERAAMRAVLAALVDNHAYGYMADDLIWYTRCRFCGNESVEGNEHHTDSCPIERARRLLGENEG